MAEASRGRILIVDDDETVRVALRRTLGRLGFEVAEESNAEDALAAAARWRPEIIFLDLRMPGAGGFSFLRHLRLSKPEPEPSVIVMSGHGGVEDVIEVLRLGAVDYVRKPWNLTELTSALSSAIEAQRVAGQSVLAPSSSALPDRLTPAYEARQARLRLLADRLRAGKIALPPASPVAQALGNPSAPPSEDQIAVLLDAHPATADHILRVANSTTLGSPGGVGDTRAAISRLGAQQVCNLMQAIALGRFCDLRDEPCRELSSLVWRRSVARASAMRALADIMDPSHTLDGDAAYLIGLLADVGALLLLWAISESPESGLSRADIGQTAHVLDFVRQNHQDLGEVVLHGWRFEAAISMIALQHHRQTPPASEVAWWNLFILGDELAGQLVAEPDPTAVGKRDARAVERSAAEFCLPRVVLEDVLGQLKDELAAILGIPEPRSRQ